MNQSGEQEGAPVETPEGPQEAVVADPERPAELEAPPMERGGTPPGAIQTYEGRLDMDRLPQSKRFQGTWLELDGGGSLVLAYRPMPEHFALVDRRVVLEARPYSPAGQSIGADHVQLESIRLAEGETALADPPDALPVPPRVQSGEEVGARVGRWVELFATLIGEREDAADGDWRTLEFRLDGGAIVVTVEASWVVDGTFRPHFGERMTLLGKVYERDGQLGLGPVEACLGEVRGCGMGAKGLRR